MFVRISDEKGFTRQELKLEFPNVSFGPGPDDEWLFENGFARVEEISAPSVADDEIAEHTGYEEVGGVWKTKWTVREYTENEKEALKAQSLAFVEDYRWQVGDAAELDVNGIRVTGEERTRAAIAETIAFFDNHPSPPASIRWQGLPDGEGSYFFYDVTRADMVSIGLAIGGRRGKSFVVKEAVTLALKAGTIFSPAQSKTMFDEGMNA